MCHRTENLVAEDMPDILLSLVLIGLDKTTSNELRASLNSALNSICETIDTQTVGLPSQLCVVCLNILVAHFCPSTTSQLRVYTSAGQ
jgi:hypothetical protein